MTIPRTSAERFDVGERALESKPLNVEQRRLGIVGCGEMRIHGVQLEIRARQQLRQRPPQVVVPEPEAVHPRVDLEVIPKAPPVACRRSLYRARGARGGDGRSETAVEEPVQIADAERAEHEDIGPDT